MLDLSSRKVYGALAEQCVGGDAKADKVESAVAGNLAGLDANGNLTDSGVSPTEEVTVEGNPVTFDSPFEQDAKSVVVSVKPIQAGSGTPSPENIRPISGIDEVEIEVSGKNIWDEQYVAGDISSTTGELVSGGYMCSKNFIKVEPNTDYTIWTSKVPTGGYYYYEYDADKNFVYGSNDMPNGSSFTTKANTHYIKFLYGSTYGYPYTNDIVVSEGSEHPTAYEPYKGSTTTIPLPSTLYDADVDVTEGSGDSRFGMVDLGTLDWTYETNGLNPYPNYFQSSGIPQGVFNSDASNYLCSHYERIPSSDFYTKDFVINMNSIYKVAVVTDTRYSDAASFKSAMSGVMLCYELATPTTISFTPTDVELLEDTNVITTNGEKVAVTYGRSLWQDIDDLKTDTEGKLDKSDVATIEEDTASKAYSVNEFMLRSDGLYKVTQPIASGASITSSNTTKTTVGEVLTALLNA